MELNSRAQKFLRNLEELSRLYQSLQDVLHLEKDALIAADLEKLTERTKAKEKIVYKIRAVDRERSILAKDLAKHLALSGSDSEARLLSLADQCDKVGEPNLARTLREVHGILSTHIARSTELNSENEAFAQSALQVLNGAMNDIKQTVTETPTYGKKGQMSGSTETQAGNFVRKEV